MVDYASKEYYEITEDENFFDVDDNRPIVLVVEDDSLPRNVLISHIRTLNYRYMQAESVTEAKGCLRYLESNLSWVDVIFLDIYLKNNENGIELLEMLMSDKYKVINKWTTIYIMSGTDDEDVVQKAFKIGLGKVEFLQKPINKLTFMQTKEDIINFIKINKCILPGYMRIREIGSGLTSKVYLVKNRKDKKSYAMKVVSLEENDKMAGLPIEVEYLKKLNAPTIIGFKESRREGNRLGLILEFAEYGSLRQKISQAMKTGVGFSTDQILDWITEVFIGLFIIHKKGVIHRDIKPDNLFLCEGDIVKIGDLGMAKTTCIAKTVCGTGLYMAPELVCYQTYNNLVDIWATGVVLYELITLKNPFLETGKEKAEDKIKNVDFQPLPEDADPRFKRLIDLTITLAYRRITINDLLRLQFIRDRVDYLFKNKFEKNDENFQLESEINETEPLSNDKRFPFELDIEREKYLKYLKLAATLNSEAVPVSISYFNSTIDAIDESSLDNSRELLKLRKDDIEKLIDLGFLVEVANTPKKKKYYQIKLYEEEGIDNTVKIKLNDQFLCYEIDSNPVGLSKECLMSITELFKQVREFITESDNIKKKEFLFSEGYLEFNITIKKLCLLDIYKCNANQKLAIILNLYQTMYLHFLLKFLYFNVDYEKMGFWKTLIDLFYSYVNYIEVIYKIGDDKISINEMKQVIIKHNKNYRKSFFNFKSNNDRIIKLLDFPNGLSAEKKMMLECICPDTSLYKYEFISELMFTCFSEENVEEQMTKHFEKFLIQNISFEKNTINVPKFFKDNLSYFNISEQEMIKKILHTYYNSSDDKKELKTSIVNLSRGNLIINYVVNDEK